MHRRRMGWLVAAGVLFALAAGLMFLGSGDEPAPEPPNVEFPRRMRTEERARAERRRTYVQPVAVATDAGVAKEPSRPRDPVIAALPRGKNKTAVVLEANALRHSPIGELLMDCILRDGGERMRRFKETTGVDPFQDLDRLVLTEDGFILSGNFGNAKFKEMLGERTAFDYGEGARIFEPGVITATRPDGTVQRGRDDSSIGTWNDQMLVVGSSPDKVKEVIDRVEGRGPDEPPVISEGSTYGEMYGVLAVEQLVKLLPPEQAEMAQRLREVAENVELHVDARSDVAMVAELRGPDQQKVTDLGKSLGAALSVARMKAQAEGQKDLAQLLDFARVQPDGNEFKMELAVPLAVIQERLSWCREERQAAEARAR